jgi:ATP-binding protein involved in chromosome partitioning
LTENTKESEQTIKLAKHVIAVASGKGGVGKTTVAVNLALSLAESGQKVGILDADIYGPNIPLMLGIENESIQVQKDKLIPIEKYNMKIMSMGFIAANEKALIWRGPLAHKLINQFLEEVQWEDLDILIIDLPPGTGDVPLTITQKANLKAAVIVTTPQEASIADVRKMIDMFHSTNTKVIGIVENMKFIACPECSKNILLYPNKDKRSISEILGKKLLVEFPFDPQIGLKEANGTPFYFSSQSSDTVQRYGKLATEILDFLNLDEISVKG